MNPATAKGWIDVLASIVQNPAALLLLLGALVCLLGWLLVRFYLRDRECRMSQSKLESMMAFLWGMLGQDERYAGRLPSYQLVQAGKVDLDQWLAAPAWTVDRRHYQRHDEKH